MAVELNIPEIGSQNWGDAVNENWEAIQTALNKINVADLLDFKWSDHILEDQSWLLADTFSWHDGTVYSLAYNLLLEEFNSSEAVITTDTISGASVTYRRTPRGFKIAEDENAVINMFNATGTAWYYILDIANTRFKLPRTKFGILGLRTNSGDFVEATLPNIRSTFYATTNGSQVGGGAVTVGGAVNQIALAGGGGYPGVGDHVFTLNAAGSSPIYKDGADLQQKGTQAHLYFYVGNFSQTAAEQTAGLNTELFNKKADLNLNNTNPAQAFKNMVVGWGMPNYAAGVAKASGSAAPSKGWAVSFGGNASLKIAVNGVFVGQGDFYPTAWSGNWNVQIMVDAGDVVTGAAWTFFPCKGV